MDQKEELKSFRDTEECAAIRDIRIDNVTSQLKGKTHIRAFKKLPLKITSAPFYSEKNQSTVNSNFLIDQTLNCYSSKNFPSIYIDIPSFVLINSENPSEKYDISSFDLSSDRSSSYYENESYYSKSHIKEKNYEEAVYRKVRSFFSLDPENIIKNFSYENLETDFVICNTQNFLYNKDTIDSSHRLYKLVKNEDHCQFTRENKLELEKDSLIIIETKKSSLNSCVAVDQLIKDFNFVTSGIQLQRNNCKDDQSFTKITSFLNKTITHYYLMIFTYGEANDLITLFNYEGLSKLVNLNPNITTYCWYIAGPDKEPEYLHKIERSLEVYKKIQKELEEFEERFQMTQKKMEEQFLRFKKIEEVLKMEKKFEEKIHSNENF